MPHRKRRIRLRRHCGSSSNGRRRCISKGNSRTPRRECGDILQQYPKHFSALHLLGVVALQSRRLQRAVELIRAAIAVNANAAAAHNNLGRALLELKRPVDALASLDAALVLEPDYAMAHNNRGLALENLNRFEEALASYDRALAILPEYSGAHSDRGLVLHQLKRSDEALASIERAYSLSPDNAEAHFGEAQTRLLCGDFEHGWEQYEWRSRGQQLRSEWRSFAQQLWRGQDSIAGKTILLHAEQGFSDTIQFCRYVPMVAERGARVILEVQPPLKELMSSLAGTTQILAAGSPLPEFEVQCPLLSLPLVFGTRLETIPATVPYLRAPPQAAIDWEPRLGASRRPRIGLAWAGRTDNRDRWHRSIFLSALLPLLDVEAIFVSLQKDVPPADAALLKERSDLLHFGDDIKDFSDTAALISNLDLVISIDTGVAHLAGALARPVWVLLLSTPDWRWLLERDDSPWYPTAPPVSAKCDRRMG